MTEDQSRQRIALRADYFVTGYYNLKIVDEKWE